MKAETEGEALRFEQIVESLEELVRALEGGELPLDEALRLYERGVHLARRGHTLLEGAERRVEELQRSLVEPGG
ncbi:MAG: exodeoxyribonuclease VII small subunit [bacterium]|nr:exodeoxyribonuclease VII small subunit [Myxococcales bacterium]MCB9542562.1 exodeoxyribonuclease VII small subunit [Myxococcales bacterium]